ncbi:CoA-disulfide reductase [Natrialba asiatica DSM 12278]|uniref:CoA-disulfide reductase n=1 Tax=Natrialba asiatica (strain ATCC 700177 / DSM 12278 / JCM 9576 / FERM P-10747 / NBRC 102637 / 172P1) TaxID=29540 RepID=M0AF68_NATA1|nr:FAD-dependent oxidoreductase [Natrialba asiatica]ELY97405.1 CoA-disulfide reductase [Natrialba asiatica DSM 12278]
MTETFVVIGGDAAGMSAASKAKREDPEREVIVFEKGEWVSYAACGMPYYVKGAVDDLDDLVTVTPEEFREGRDVDLRTSAEVVGIDLDAQTVTVETCDETDEQPYDDLLVATGGGDAKTLRNAGVPTVEFALATDTVHAVDEYTTVDALIGNAMVYARLPEVWASAVDRMDPSG